MDSQFPLPRLPAEIIHRICQCFVDAAPLEICGGGVGNAARKQGSAQSAGKPESAKLNEIMGLSRLLMVDPAFLAAKRRAENRQTLFACLQVSRQWFQCAMPFIWQHPQLHLLSNELIINPGNEDLWTRQFADLIRVVELPPEHHQERRRRRRDNRFSLQPDYQPVNDGEMMLLLSKCRYLQKVDLTPLSHLSTLAAMDSMMSTHREYARRRSDPEQSYAEMNCEDDLSFKEPSTGLLYLDYTLDALVNSRQTLRSLSMRCWNGSAYAQTFWPTLLEKFRKSIRSSPALFGRLTSLDVSESYLLTDATFTEPLFGGQVSLMPQLTRLNISSLPFLTDKSIELILKQCPRLKELNVAYCPQITDQSLVMMRECQPFRDTLETLHVGGCCGFSANGLESLFGGTEPWRNLQELNMTYLPVTDACLELMTENVPLLSSLRLMSCKQVSADAIARLIEIRGYSEDDEHENLAWLDLSFCDSVLPEYMAICSSA